MQIRKATVQDAKAISQVAESVRFLAGQADPNQGYLVFVGTPEEYAARLTGNDTSYVAEDNGRLDGFLLTSAVVDEAGIHDTATHVPTDAVEKLLFANGTLLVDQIGVRLDARGRGVAAQLYERMMTDQKPARVTASIMHGPLKNNRSLGFFVGKQGFKCIGEYHEGFGFLWGVYEWKADSTQGDLRYPLGRWLDCGVANEKDLAARVERLRFLPEQLRAAVKAFGEDALDAVPHRGAWSARQLVHHMADAHLQMTSRVRLILTEDRPQIKTFDENTWAELADAKSAPIEESLHILDGLHARIVLLIASRPHSDMLREMVHPEQGPVKLDRLLSYLDWHGRHHTAQVEQFRTQP